MAETKKPVTEKKTVEVDPWQDMVEIALDRAPSKEQNFQLVIVNGRRFQVPRDGKPYQVPRPVYEVLMNAREAQQRALDRKAELRSQD